MAYTMSPFPLRFESRQGGGGPPSPIAILGGALVGWYDAADATRRFQETLGYTPVADSDPVGLLMDKSQGGSPASMHKGLGGAFDYYIDADGGSDGNTGTSAGAAWATLSKITSAIVPTSGTVRVLVKSGAYDTADDYVLVQTGDTENSGAVLEIVFEPGCTMDGTAANAVEPTNGFELSGNNPWIARIYGNGLQVDDYAEGTAASPNGVGNRGYQITHVYDVHCDNCDDGFSAHENASLYLYDCSAINAEKGAFINVDNSHFEANRCYFEVTTGTTGAGSAGVTQVLNDCVLVSATNQSVLLSNTELTRCQLGTLTVSIEINALNGPATLTDCFVNSYVQGNSTASLLRCFGKLSVRNRIGGTISIDNCVFSGLASSNAVLFLGTDLTAGSSGPIHIRNTAFYGNFTWGNTNTNAQTNWGYLAANGSQFYNNSFYGGVAYPSGFTGVVTATGTLTDDPLIGDADSLVMADYAYGDGSPCIGAGTSGGNIGFGASEVDERVPQEVRGPDGVAGNHASQGTDANRPTLTGGYLVHSGSDALSATFADLGVDATIGYVTSGGVTWLDDQTISGATNLVPAADWREMVVADGAVSAGDKTAIEEWFAR